MSNEAYNEKDYTDYLISQLQEANETLEKRCERYRELLEAVIDNLSLSICRKCGHLHMRGHICYMCRYDGSVGDYRR